MNAHLPRTGPHRPVPNRHPAPPPPSPGAGGQAKKALAQVPARALEHEFKKLSDKLGDRVGEYEKQLKDKLSRARCNTSPKQVDDAARKLKAIAVGRYAKKAADLARAQAKQGQEVRKARTVKERLQATLDLMRNGADSARNQQDLLRSLAEANRLREEASARCQPASRRSPSSRFGPIAHYHRDTFHPGRPPLLASPGSGAPTPPALPEPPLRVPIGAV